MSGNTYVVRHRSAYHYAEPALQSQNLACLHPRSCAGQTVEQVLLRIDPKPDWRQSWHDAYGNLRESFSLSSPHTELQVTLLARVRRAPPPDGQCPLAWEDAVLPDGAAWTGADPLQREFAFPSPLLPALAEPGFEADDCFPPGRPVLEALDAFMERVHEIFTYDPKATTTFTPIDEVLEKKAGVCQDFAHAAIAELRRRGFSAGYVSGYLETQPPPGREKMRGADATHAWYAVHVPTLGWVHFDPTNKMRVGDRHLITAWGRDYADIAPLKGVLLGGGEHEIEVEVDVWSWPDQVPEDVSASF
jgi:transglutaminase-like putative cysteine protease